MPIETNADPEHKCTDGEHSTIYHPPAHNDTDQQGGQKPIPDTGWAGPIPSADGGEDEEDYMNKPPYHWTSEKFVPKYQRQVNRLSV